MDMRIKKHIFVISLLLSCLTCAVSCTYESEPPKTEGAASTYVLPKGEVPSADEKAVADAAKTEYENYLKL